MTAKLFWSDPYATQCDATVTAAGVDWIELDRTIFFAECGGQESDHGSIAGCPVRQATLHDDGRIDYALDPGHGLTPGRAVKVQIDWARRYALMRLHFAAEIVLELAVRQFPGVERIGAHIAPDKARIDFVWPENVAPALPAIADAANAIVAADRPILSAFEPGMETAERRYWEIEGFARVPCGGTHLKRSGEIGAIALKRRNPGKGKERIEISATAPLG
ncbi:MAG: alanyl-tRNA editing protein [Alphaproteobacteria bacterium]|nr:alanyl-tRNA editing protein [Alphaproteobacteria bacterium]